jgi:hypothetical protein
VTNHPQFNAMTLEQLIDYIPKCGRRWKLGHLGNSRKGWHCDLVRNSEKNPEAYTYAQQTAFTAKEALVGAMLRAIKASDSEQAEADKLPDFAPLEDAVRRAIDERGRAKWREIAEQQRRQQAAFRGPEPQPAADDEDEYL